MLRLWIKVSECADWSSVTSPERSLVATHTTWALTGQQSHNLSVDWSRRYSYNMTRWLVHWLNRYLLIGLYLATVANLPVSPLPGCTVHLCMNIHHFNRVSYRPRVQSHLSLTHKTSSSGFAEGWQSVTSDLSVDRRWWSPVRWTVSGHHVLQHWIIMSLGSKRSWPRSDYSTIHMHCVSNNARLNVKCHWPL